jgi:hypothetical protein
MRGALLFLKGVCIRGNGYVDERSFLAHKSAVLRFYPSDTVLLSFKLSRV